MLTQANGEVTLDTGGWQTVQTKSGMNLVLSQIGLFIESKGDVRRGEWFLTNGRGWSVPYSDKMNVGVPTKGAGYKRRNLLTAAFRPGDKTCPTIINLPGANGGNGARGSMHTQRKANRYRPY